MGIRTELGKPSFIISLIFSLLISLSVSWVNTSQGKEIYADIWWQILFPIILLFICCVTLFTTWKTTSRQNKYFVFSGIGVLLLLSISAISLNWKYLPWVRANAFQTANQFLTDLKNQDAASAFEKLSPLVRKHISSSVFHFPATQPSSWQLEVIDRHSTITGNVTFSDGIQLPIEIRLEWLNNKWSIYGVKIGAMENLFSSDEKIRPRVYFMYCCDNSGIVDRVFSLVNGNDEVGYNFSR